MKRVFIAIDISEEARRRAAEYIDDLRREFSHVRVGWEKPEKIHLTLKFLNEVSADGVARVINAIAQIAASSPSFNVKISETGVFPSRDKPRVLWLGVRNEVGSRWEIAARIEKECESLGFEREKRGFNPHLTVARIREPWHSSPLGYRHIETSFDPVVFEVREIVIYESKLQPTGSVYTKLAAFPLRSS